MVEKHTDEESVATTATLPVSVEEREAPEDDVVANLLVARLSKAIKDKNSTLVESMLAVLLAMDLDLPENSVACEFICKTSILEDLFKNLIDLQHKERFESKSYGWELLVKNAAVLLGKLISSGPATNSAKCYQLGALPILVDGLNGGKGNQYRQVELFKNLLKLLKVEGKPTTEFSCLLDASSIDAVVRAMHLQNDVQEWGCSTIHYIVQGWELSNSRLPRHHAGSIESDIGQLLLQAGAIDAIIYALTSKPQQQYYPSPTTIHEASLCISLVGKASPSICPTLVAKGIIALLGNAMQKWPKEKAMVMVPAQEALMVILANPSA